jgi:hypothetical protein
VSEIIELKRRYNIGGLWINDDTFSFDYAWADKFCDLLIANKLNIFWAANGRVNTARRDLLEKMKKAGCVILFMTFECGSDRVRNKILHKGFTNAQIISAYDMVHEIGLLTRTNIMLASPTESEEELRESMAMVKAVQPHFVTASYTTPLPGTYMYQDCLSKGILGEERGWEFYDISHFKNINSPIPPARLKSVYGDIQRGYHSSFPVNRARHFFSVKNFRKILYQRWGSLLFNRHPNIGHFLFDLAAVILGSFSYFMHKNRYARVASNQ